MQTCEWLANNPWALSCETWSEQAEPHQPRRGLAKRFYAEGPWHAEPDRIEWRHQGLPCLISRSSLTGSLCGYAGVGPDHPLHGQGYSTVERSVLVHGGLTYADGCDEGGHICHVAQPGEPESVWWFGFDCAHAGDISPGMDAVRQQYGSPPRLLGRGLWAERYWTVEAVRLETEQLVEQLVAAGNPNVQAVLCAVRAGLGREVLSVEELGAE